MNTFTNTAPVMVELQNDQIVMNKSIVQTLLEEVLKIKQKLGQGKTPVEAYKSAVTTATDMFRFEKSNMTQKEMIQVMQERITLVDFYFNEFVQFEEPSKEAPIDTDSQMSRQEDMVGYIAGAKVYSSRPE